MHCRCPHGHKAIEIVEETLLISGYLCPGASAIPVRPESEFPRRQSITLPTKMPRRETKSSVLEVGSAQSRAVERPVK